jgi:type VI secretion system protein ImpH
MTSIGGGHGGGPTERGGSAAGLEPPPALQTLFAKPQTFELFQAVRLVEWEAATRARGGNAPLPAPVGGIGAGGGVNSPVRFRSATTLGFPDGAITRITHDAPGSAASLGMVHMELACFGFIGPAGTLPRHYTSLVLERYRRHRDTTLRDFLDIFLQRLAPLLYRAWAKYRPSIQYEQTLLRSRSAAWDEAARVVRDPVTAVVASLAGIGGTALDGRMQVSDVAVVAFAAHFARQPRSAGCLEQMLVEVVGTGVRVVQFVGRWLRLEPADLTRLAGGAASEGRHARLGIDTIVGNRVWSVESAFEVRLGPLDDVGFRSRLPGGPLLAALGDFIRLYAGPQYHVWIRLVLAAADVPGSRLGGSPVDARGLPSGTRLGWTSWLVGHDGAAADRDDAAFVVTA